MVEGKGVFKTAEHNVVQWFLVSVIVGVGVNVRNGVSFNINVSVSVGEKVKQLGACVSITINT